MAVKSGAEYIESIRKMDPNAYYRGEKIGNIVEHPVFKDALTCPAKIYDMTLAPQYEDLMTETSYLTGEKISGFVHMPRSREDLLKEVKKTRAFTSKTFGCTPRCNALGLLIPIAVTTYDMDQKLGTHYHQTFNEFLRRVQNEDLACTTATTNVKGDRSKRPKEQTDPDMHLRMVEKRKDGIIVRGAQAHASAALFVNECIVAPTTAIRTDEREYAVCFAIPVDAKGITYIVQDGVSQAKRFAEGGVDFGLSELGELGGLMILDNVFVPWERVFMCGEAEFTPQLIEGFGTYHRNVPAACKAGWIDVMLGAAECIAEYNGVAKVSQIREKITDMAISADICYAAALGACWEAHETPSGIYHPDVSLANSARYRCVQGWLEAEHLLSDIAGGLAFTMPSEKDLRDPVLGKYLDKYLKGVDGVSVEDRMRMFRLIQIMVTEPRGHPYICAGGSPEPHRIFIYRNIDLEGKKKLAKNIAGIKK